MNALWPSTQDLYGRLATDSKDLWQYPVVDSTVKRLAFVIDIHVPEMMYPFTFNTIQYTIQYYTIFNTITRYHFLIIMTQEFQSVHMMSGKRRKEQIQAQANKKNPNNKQNPSKPQPKPTKKPHQNPTKSPQNPTRNPSTKNPNPNQINTNQPKQNQTIL